MTTAIKNLDPAKYEAAALFSELRDNLLATEHTIAEIVTTKAWEPLGYPTLADAWADQMQGVRLAGAVQATILYAMFETGTSTMDVAAVIAGIGPAKAAAYRHAYERNMTTQQAERHASSMTRRTVSHNETVVASHTRKIGKPRGRVTIDGFSMEEIRGWKQAAAAADIDFGTWARNAFRKGAEQ